MRIIAYPAHPQVRVRVRVQTQRQPVQYTFGPWTTYIELGDRIIALPTTAMPPSKPIRANQMGLFLVIVLVPVGVVLLVTTGAILFLFFGCWYKKKYVANERVN